MAITIKILPQGIAVNARQGDRLLEVLQRAGIPLEAACGGQGTCGRCAVQIVEGRCQSSGSEILPAKMIKEGFILCCKATVTESVVVHIPATTEVFRGDITPAHIPEATMALRGNLSPLSFKKIDARAGSKGAHDRNFGIACDMGTTTVALKLVDLKTGHILDTVSAYNDQIACGSDVISRIIYAQKKGHLQELKDRMIKTINGLLGAILPMHKVSPDEVTGGVFAGNTTMTYLVLGLDPAPIRELSGGPVMKSPPLTTAGEMGIHIHPDAPILLSPGAGSYVGGDITAGLLFTQLFRPRHGLELFIDIGTNGELVIRGEDWMIGCACSAGPAFEGVGIKCGMRASTGAIEGAEVLQGGLMIDFKVIGGGKPRGVCGSGLIELVASLFTSGILGRDGKFTDKTPGERIRVRGKQKSFVIADESMTAEGKAIVITEQDIANIMRAKAAIYSASSLLLRNVGLSGRDIEKIHVAGGFGRSLNIRNAVTLGMFPDLPPDRFEYLGNTSLMGAYLALLSSDHRKTLNDIAASMTYIDLSSEPNYMHEYTAALFLPHTDETLFPSVSRP